MVGDNQWPTPLGHDGKITAAVGTRFAHYSLTPHSMRLTPVSPTDFMGVLLTDSAGSNQRINEFLLFV